MQMRYRATWCAFSMLAISLLTSCDSPPPKPDYSFFVAGHVYGPAGKSAVGMHAPFVSSFSYLNERGGLELGVLTGDVVATPTQEHWDTVRAQLSKLNMPVHIAPGNHDRGALFNQNFQKPPYSFVRHKDLFVVLSPTKWNIEGNQLEFLKQEVNTHSQTARNIFIFCHELIWRHGMLL